MNTKYGKQEGHDAKCVHPFGTAMSSDYIIMCLASWTIWVTDGSGEKWVKLFVWPTCNKCHKFKIKCRLFSHNCDVLYQNSNFLFQDVNFFNLISLNYLKNLTYCIVLTFYLKIFIFISWNWLLSQNFDFDGPKKKKNLNTSHNHNENLCLQFVYKSAFLLQHLLSESEAQAVRTCFPAFSISLQFGASE